MLNIGRTAIKRNHSTIWITGKKNLNLEEQLCCCSSLSSWWSRICCWKWINASQQAFTNQNCVHQWPGTAGSWGHNVLMTKQTCSTNYVTHHRAHRMTWQKILAVEQYRHYSINHKEQVKWRLGQWLIIVFLPNNTLDYMQMPCVQCCAAAWRSKLHGNISLNARNRREIKTFTKQQKQHSCFQLFILWGLHPWLMLCVKRALSLSYRCLPSY